MVPIQELELKLNKVATDDALLGSTARNKKYLNTARHRTVMDYSSVYFKNKEEEEMLAGIYLYMHSSGKLSKRTQVKLT